MRAEDKEFNSGSRNIEFSDRAEEFTKSAAPSLKKQDKKQEEKREKSKQKRLLRVFLTAAVGVTVLSGAVKLPGSRNLKDLRGILSTVETYVEHEQYEELIELTLDEDVVAVLDAKLGENGGWYGFDGTTVFPLEDGVSYDFDGMVFEYVGDWGLEGYVGCFENGTINGPTTGFILNPEATLCTFYNFGMEDAQIESEVSYVNYYSFPNVDQKWYQWSVEGNVNSKWVFEGTINLQFSEIPAEIVSNICFNVDGNGRLIEDEHVTWDREEKDKIIFFTRDGKTFWTFGEMNYIIAYGEDSEMIDLWNIRYLPEILNCDYYIADDTDEIPDTQPDEIPDTQPDGTQDAQTEQVETEAAEISDIINSKELNEILSNVETYVENEQYEEVEGLLRDDDVTAVLDEKLEPWVGYGFDGTMVFPLSSEISYNFDGILFYYDGSGDQQEELLIYDCSVENGEISGTVIMCDIRVDKLRGSGNYGCFEIEDGQVVGDFLSILYDVDHTGEYQSFIHLREGYVNEKGNYEGTMTDHVSVISEGITCDLTYNVDENGYIIKDEQFYQSGYLTWCENNELVSSIIMGPDFRRSVPTWILYFFPQVNPLVQNQVDD